MTKNFPNSMEYESTQQAPNRIKAKKSILRYIIIKLSKDKDMLGINSGSIIGILLLDNVVLDHEDNYNLLKYSDPRELRW